MPHPDVPVRHRGGHGVCLNRLDPRDLLASCEAYLRVFAASAFSLLGLRQLSTFLIDGLLDRIIFLHYGLAAIGFARLQADQPRAAHERHFINGGQPLLRFLSRRIAQLNSASSWLPFTIGRCLWRVTLPAWRG